MKIKPTQLNKDKTTERLPCLLEADYLDLSERFCTDQPPVSENYHIILFTEHEVMLGD